MKKRFNTIRKVVAAFALLTTVCVACNDDNLGEADRLFRPIATTSTTTSNMRALISVEWENPIPNANSYTLELYRDSLGAEDMQFTPVAVATTTNLNYTFGEAEELAWDTPYYVRVKAVGLKESKFFVCKVVTTNDYPTHLKPVDASELIDQAFIARWEPQGEKYTVLDITNSKDSVLMRLDISAATDSYRVTGLKANTNYKMKIYAGQMPAAPEAGKPFTAMPDNTYRGKRTLKTLAAQVYANACDLTLLADDVARGMITTAFLDTLRDNSTVLLKGGLTYTINGATFSNKSVKFVSKYSLDGFARLGIQAAFKLGDNKNIEQLEFENLNLFTPNADETTANYGGGYVFNLSNSAPVKVTTLSMKGCNFRFFRGILRTQSAQEISNLLFENCTMHRIGGYGIVACDNAASKIGNISLTKSTITYADRGIYSNKAEGATTQVTVDQCTFCYSPITDSKTYLFDFSTFTVQVKLTNSIFGASRVAAGLGVYAWNGSKATQDVSGSYITKDFEYALNTEGAPAKPFDATMGKYNGTSTELFKDPANLNFTLIDSRVDGAGDPRWK